MTTLALVAGHKHTPKIVHHRPGCRTVRCDRWADAEAQRHRVAARRRRERARARRVARELAEGWAIPAEIVRCESGFTNDAPNYAGAAGYYQLTEWPSKSQGLPVGHSGFANEHSKAEQGIVARRLFREQGTGPWVSSEPCWGGRI